MAFRRKKNSDIHNRTLQTYYRHFKIDAANYKEIKHEEEVSDEEDSNTRYNTERERAVGTDQEYDIAENTQNEMVTNTGKETEEKKNEYVNENKFREKIEREHNKRKSTCVKGLEYVINKPRTKKTGT